MDESLSAASEFAECLKVVLFTIAGDRFALPLDSVVEVVSLSDRPEILERRGRSLPVVDGAALLGTTGERPPKRHGIIVDAAGARAVLDVDGTVGVEAVDEDRLSAPPGRYPDLTRALVRGTFEAPEGGLAVLLDPARIVALATRRDRPSADSASA